MSGKKIVLALIIFCIISICPASRISLATTTDPGYIWWEAENPLETNFPKETEFSAHTFPETRHLLSGEEWLTHGGENVFRGKDEAYIKYEVNIPSDGEYNFWTRKFWKHSPFRWRFDNEEWQICPFEVALIDAVEFRRYLCANWVYLGNINLKKGRHILEIRLLAKEGEALPCGFDCFLLSTLSALPHGKFKPGEKSGLTAEGFWPFEPSADVFKSSPLDLRYLNEKVAGESGYVQRKEDQLILGNGTPVRFWAVDAGGDIVRNDKNSVKYLARRLAKYGVNMVRVHTSMYDRSPGNFAKIDRVFLDKLHYFVQTMKNEGIYVNLSFYFPLWVEVKPEYGLAGYETIENKRPFALLMFDETFQGIYQSWARELLLTKNPYTGIPLAEDPAVAIIEVQNEDSFLFPTFEKRNIPVVQMEKLERLFHDWLLLKYGSIEKAVAAWGGNILVEGDLPDESRMMVLDVYNLTSQGHGRGGKRNRMRDQLEFLIETQKGFYEQMTAFYRDEIKTKSMISCSNWSTADARLLDVLERYTYTAGDIIDRHVYFNSDHQGWESEFSVAEWHTFRSRSSLLEPGRTIVQMNQVKDYPHMTTETGWTNPNRFKAEAPAMWGAYGSLQGVDAIHFFAVGSVDWEGSSNKFALMIPSFFGQFPGYALMYRRGDVKEAETVIHVVHSLQELYNFKGAPIYENQGLDQLRAQ